MYFKEIVLAGLLHDIGKFYQKAKQTPINNSGKHPKVSKEFVKTYFNFFNKYVDASVLMEFVARHHEDSRYFEEEFLAGYGDENLKDYTYIVATADNLSSKERDESKFGKYDFKVRPLNCVFNRINILNENNGNQVFSYKSDKYNVNNIIPQDLAKNDNYSNEILVQNFTNEINLLSQNPPKNFNHLMIILDRILKKYLWCIPASSQDIVSDISLYDHLKTTSAIASTLYLYQRSINKINRNNINDDHFKYILVGFNFSNIQDYIIGIFNANKNGVSKQLKTRSFIIDIIIEGICKELLEQFDLPIQNKLLLIGGKCFILLPNINNYILQFNEIMRSINIDLYDRYKCDICINYDFIEMNKNSFENYGDVLLALTKKLDSKKFKPFESIFVKDNKWDLDSFILYENLDNKILCTQCNKRLIDKKQNICEECSTQISIGAMLPKAKYIIFTKLKGTYLFLNNSIDFVSEIEDNNFDYAIQLDDFENNNNINLPINVKNIANYVSLDENNNTLTFEDIALKSKGTKKLALIKIDVDNLSYLLKEGFKKDKKNFATISRVETFSRMLDMFFTSYVKNILKEKFKNTYCIYSGGDDLLLICPFSDAVSLTREIMLKFNAYVGQNNNFKLSASIIAFSPKVHISLVLDECNKHLQNIKSNSGNKIYFMGEYFSEEIFTKLFLDRAKLIINEIDKIDINILRRVSKYSDMYRNFIDKKDIMQLMFAPLFDRDIKRNYKELEKTNFYKYINKITENIADYRSKKKNSELYYINKVIKYVLLITKEERVNE